MVLNVIWVSFFLIGILVSLSKLLIYKDPSAFNDMTAYLVGGQLSELDANGDPKSTSGMARVAAELSLGYIGLMALWLGIMKIGEDGGAVRVLSRIVGPFFRCLFPGIPREHPATGAIMMNFSANMLGLDNAATPLGLKAMHELQSLNEEKDRASDAQIMFLVLNTSGLTIIPVSVITLRAINGAANPTDIFLPILIATFFATLVGMISVAIVQRINLLKPVVFAYVGAALALVIGMIFWFGQLNPDQVQAQSKTLASLIIFGLLGWFFVLALLSRVNLYESFITGAKDGFGVAIKIIPYLVAMLVAIGVFRASGAMDHLMNGFSWLVGALGMNTQFVDALPTAAMKPLSGSGARGLAVETMQAFGADSFAGRLACTFQGSTETTFYTLAVYFGAVGVTRTRYTVACGLLADFAGIVAAIFVAYLFFGS
ncbi:MAG: nucleoside recognition domain-containing protein [Verrucomicrobiota bacterium]